MKDTRYTSVILAVLETLPELAGSTFVRTMDDLFGVAARMGHQVRMEPREAENGELMIMFSRKAVDDRDPEPPSMSTVDNVLSSLYQAVRTAARDQRIRKKLPVNDICDHSFEDLIDDMSARGVSVLNAHHLKSPKDEVSSPFIGICFRPRKDAYQDRQVYEVLFVENSKGSKVQSASYPGDNIDEVLARARSSMPAAIILGVTMLHARRVLEESSK